MQIANLGARRVVDDPAAVAAQRALRFGMNSGAASTQTGAARRRLPIASPVPAQQARRRCRCPDEAATSPLVGRLLETDEDVGQRCDW